ncbi:hypothetical protein EMIHUDRAFT_224168 [Emiliania huxleyi CCMP1516]|uniref:Uncharacterized protein n=2 Tax=Emiliania huxleyi TaxID=2903 RepID=A0A0D3KSM8_EMIH1|nr:hypothetical protein EMIHUDRAFT_224168 [Emiliania huxleyi CCMP1516]EOD38763.1 hypothetical protein EMIHUDRAFT_224168 [Emiliania huxleyi CCMP1516]|eukprot:XP_005791192.1 hypothetical protein EMIHUDRAFT_224168 [Emiliania huxleyi CCMP1516]
MADGKRFAFVFTTASGHTNPSLPIARLLVGRGHEVIYLSSAVFQTAIEGTGAAFVDETAVLTDLYHSGMDNFMLMFKGLVTEFGCETAPFVKQQLKVKNVIVERQLPGLIRFLKEASPPFDAVVYDPIMMNAAGIACLLLDLPAVALLTVAGPGAAEALYHDLAGKAGMRLEDLDREYHEDETNTGAIERMRARYPGIFLPGAHPYSLPMTHSYVGGRRAAALVTTIEPLCDTMSKEMAAALEELQIRFFYIGPSLDVEGAVRAGGFKSTKEEGGGVGEVEGAPSPTPLPPFRSDVGDTSGAALAAVREASALGAPVLYVSLGTVLTSDLPFNGWNSREKDGAREFGITGKQLVQSVLRAAFEEFGAPDEAEPARRGSVSDLACVCRGEPLLVCSTGPQPDALEGLTVPPNAVCRSYIPQVDLLSSGAVGMFVTHGGQNSFTESMANGVPLVVVPGFGDQPVNGRKAERLGLGVAVPRPQEDSAAVIEEYVRDLRQAMRGVLEGESYVAKARAMAEAIKGAGGAERAAEIVVGLA